MNIKTLTGNNHEQMNFSKMVAVIVDPVDNMRGSMANMLLGIGLAKVHQAKHGLEALQVIGRTKIDLVVSEWDMPKMDGIQLLKKIRDDAKTAHIPFIMVSATAEHTEVIHAVKMGVSEYIVKPFSPKILEERIVRSISNPIKISASKFKKNHKHQQEKQAIQILVVDDVPDNIHIISELLRHDYKLRAATSGEKALQICKSHTPPDLVLLDIMMPKMSGLEVCKTLKSNPLTEHIQIVFLTALDQTEDVVTGLELGAVDYIVKPVNPPVLKARVKTQEKVIQASRDMRIQIDTLIENARLKEEFDRVIQNDLKQPLDEMNKTINLLAKQSKDPVRVKQSSQGLMLSCTHMTQMIDNMLLLSKLEDGSYDFDPVMINLLKVVNTAVDTYNQSSTQKRLEILLEISNGAVIYAEALLCHAIINNLLKNAIEAAPRGSAITIKAERKSENLVLSIHNYGAIPEEIRANFFGKYVTYGKKNCTGLGTYSAKLMTLAQKGELTFTTNDDGTTLYFIMPAAR